ncbi:MAG: hypothetical protein ACI4GC_04805 [Acutalibacteraceae bacterium]
MSQKHFIGEATSFARQGNFMKYGLTAVMKSASTLTLNEVMSCGHK